MVAAKKRVFLTGATGNMGIEVLREFVRRSDRFEVTALVMPGDRDRVIIEEFAGEPSVTVQYGDVTSYRTVESCVARSDIVAHLGALVSPYADEHPQRTTEVNVGGALNIIAAVRAQPDPASVAVIMIGSVAEFGDRNPPLHWGRIGDPLAPSEYDNYAQSKISAERALVDSGLPRWAWLRQTGIFHPGMLAIRDAIMLHVPLGGVLEWVSAVDSARLIANACEDDAPEEFWGGIYNIGGGTGWRLTNWELQLRIGEALGVRDIRRWYDRNWFATKNFHGLWFTDSDALQELLHFRSGGFEQALEDAVAKQSALTRLARFIPASLVKRSSLPSAAANAARCPGSTRMTRPAFAPTSVHDRSGSRSATGPRSRRRGRRGCRCCSSTVTTRGSEVRRGSGRRCARRRASAAASSARHPRESMTRPRCRGPAPMATASWGRRVSCSVPAIGALCASPTLPASSARPSTIRFSRSCSAERAAQAPGSTFALAARFGAGSAIPSPTARPAARPVTISEMSMPTRSFRI